MTRPRCAAQPFSSSRLSLVGAGALVGGTTLLPARGRHRDHCRTGDLRRHVEPSCAQRARRAADDAGMDRREPLAAHSNADTRCVGKPTVCTRGSTWQRCAAVASLAADRSQQPRAVGMGTITNWSTDDPGYTCASIPSSAAMVSKVLQQHGYATVPSASGI